METLRIYSVTWNTNARDPPDGLNCSSLLALSPEINEEDLPDIYAIGFQEVIARVDRFLYDSFVVGEDAWTSAVRRALIPFDYVKIKSIRLVGIVLSIFVRRKHVCHVRNMETKFTRLSLGGYVGLKGGVSVRLNLYGISLCFVNSHLSAHDHLLDRRVEEYNTLVSEPSFKQDYTTKILYHDYIFWLGDLNFRLRENTISADEIVGAIKSDQLSNLLALDQLSQVRREGRAFHELKEMLPKFPPTYKFVVGTDQYDTKRRPAWCDRILYRVNFNNYENAELSIQQTEYTSMSEGVYRTCSDHLPVLSQFSIKVFGPELSLQRNISDYGRIIRFRFPGGRDDEDIMTEDGESRPEDALEAPQWFLGEDAIVKYTLEPGAGLFLNTWDWIGLFRDGFTSLDDYICFCWASSCRRTGVTKSCVMTDSELLTLGRYRLIYISAKQSVLGMSEPFLIGQRSQLPIELAEEAHED